MPEPLFQRLLQYASQHGLRVAEKLGSGIHGLVHIAFNESSLDKSAIKAHLEQETYRKERDAYIRLRAASVHQIQGLHVPQLLSFDDELEVIEMGIVSKPYLLDFAGISLDHPTNFSEELWREWETQKREQFGHYWAMVQKVRDDLEIYGIYLNDVSPSNIAWE